MTDGSITLFTTERGYDTKAEANKDLSHNCKFVKTTTDFDGLVNLINSKKTFCNTFSEKDWFKCSDKTNDNLLSFQLVVLDYDHQAKDYQHILKALEGEAKPLPNIVFHGFSEGKDNEHSFKFVYVLKTPTENIRDTENNKCYRHGRIQRGIANHIGRLTGVDCDNSAMKDSQCYYGGAVCYTNKSEYGFLDLQRAFGIDTTYTGGGKTVRSEIWDKFGYTIPNGTIKRQIDDVIRQMTDDVEVTNRKRYSHTERPSIDGEYRMNLIGYQRFDCFRWNRKKMTDFRKRHLYFIAKDLRGSGLNDKEILFQLLTEAKDWFAFPKDKELTFQHIITAFECGLTCDDELKELRPLAIHKKGATISEIRRNNSECLNMWIRQKYDHTKSVEDNCKWFNENPCYNGMHYKFSVHHIQDVVGDYFTKRRTEQKNETKERNEKTVKETLRFVTDKLLKDMGKKKIVDAYKGIGRTKVEELLKANGFDLKDRQVRELTKAFKAWIEELKVKVIEQGEHIEVLETRIEELETKIEEQEIINENQRIMNEEQKGFNKYVSDTITAQQHQINILNYERLNNE